MGCIAVSGEREEGASLEGGLQHDQTPKPMPSPQGLRAPKQTHENSGGGGGDAGPGALPALRLGSWVNSKGSTCDLRLVHPTL